MCAQKRILTPDEEMEAKVITSKNNKHTIGDLHQMQSLPLNIKIAMTRRRISDWVDAFGEDGVYVSFSGGKDSTVLLDLVRKDFPNIPAVFVDTGLEYPEIRDFVRGFKNVVWLKPKMNFKQVIEKYGYPFISKEVSNCVDGARKYLKYIDNVKSKNKILTDSAVCLLHGGFVEDRPTNKQTKQTISRTKKGKYP